MILAGRKNIGPTAFTRAGKISLLEEILLYNQLTLVVSGVGGPISIGGLGARECSPIFLLSLNDWFHTTTSKVPSRISSNSNILYVYNCVYIIYMYTYPLTSQRIEPCYQHASNMHMHEAASLLSPPQKHETLNIAVLP